MRKKSYGKFGMKDTESLINHAKNTVGIKEGIAGLVLDIRHILMQLEMIDGFIAEIESEMEATLEKIPYSPKLLSIKGLGVVSVAGIIGEVGNYMKFGTQSEIMKLAGLDLYEISSGKRREKKIEEGEEPSPQDTLLCGYPDHKKERHHVRILRNPHKQGNEENDGAYCHSQVSFSESYMLL